MSRWWNFGSLYDTDDDDELENNSSSSIWGYGSGSSRKYKSSLGWSSRKLTDTTSSYSSWGSNFNSYYGSSIGEEERQKLILLTKAHKAVRDMIVILDFPFDVNIRLSNYYTGISGKKTRYLNIPSDVIDSSDYSDDEKINILCGLGTHEAAHLKYTEYRVYKRFSAGASRTTRFFTNLIEDTRVEDKLLSERPGYLDFIENANEFRYSRLVKKFGSVIISDGELRELLFEIIKFIRFPNKIIPERIKENEKYFKRIQEMLNYDHEFTKDSCVIGNKLSEYILMILSDFEYTREKLENNVINILYPEASFEVKYGFDEGIDASLLGDEVSSLFKDSGSKARLYTDIISGCTELGDSLESFIEKPNGDITGYNRMKENIQRYIPGIKKLIQGTDKNYDFTIHGCREGLLDTNKLAEAYQGVPQVYIKTGKVSTNKTTVCVLIDQSGSMHGTKEILAKQAAILLNESLKDLPGVDLYIYGHSADMKTYGDTVIYAYREGSHYTPKYSLSAANALRENRDGTAILETAKRVRKYTQEKCIMFILSDGSPCAYGYYGREAIRDVKNKVNEVEKMGFTVIQISIDQVREAKDMFSNVISLEYDIANLPKRLSQVIKKAIVKDKQTTVS